MASARLRQLFGGFRKRTKTQNVAQQDAQNLLPAEQSQRQGFRHLARLALEKSRQTFAVFARGTGAIEVPQLFDPLRVLQDLF